MPTITFVQPDGTRRDVPATNGASIMRAAVAADVDGILAECGGSAACATCHVFIAPIPGLPPRSDLEDDTLDLTSVPIREDSRLSCQVFMTAELDGIVVQIPGGQV